MISKIEQAKNLIKAVSHIESAKKNLDGMATSNPTLNKIDSLLTEAYGLAREELAASEI